MGGVYAHPAHTVVPKLHQALFTHRVLAGQVDAAAIIDIHDLDPGHVADLEHILDLFGALELRTVLSHRQVQRQASAFQPCHDVPRG